MRRAFFQAAVAGVLVLSACSEARRNPGLPSEATRPASPAAQGSSSTASCPTLDELKALAALVFGPASPDYNSLRGKLDNLQHQLDIGNTAEARNKGYDIVKFVLDKGQGEYVDDLVNGVLCLAGIDGSITDPDNSFIVNPSDQDQTEVRDDGQAGITIPGGSLDSPTLVTIGPASGLLHTKLDQYPGIFNVTSTEDIDGDFIIGVCLSVSVPEEVFDRLQLGHDLSDTEFEISAKTDPPPGLTCPTSFSYLDKLPRWLAGVARFLLPQPLSAAVLLGGGVGGSAGKLSPFAPVDPTLSATGGTGGSAGKLSPPALLQSGDGPRPSVVDCSAPIGAQVSQACRPEITIKTYNGTLFTGVAVDFEVGGGGGLVAPEVTGCDPSATSTQVNTNAFGVARVCWTLGTETGANAQKVWATPQAGTGDAPLGVTFEPAVTTFFNTANPPDHLEFLQQPTNTTAGQAIAPAPTVVVHDLNHHQVTIATELVSLSLSSNSFTAGSTTGVNAVGGLATFSNLAITKAATGYTIDASYSAVTGATSSPFDVLAGPASLIKTYMPPASPVEAQSFDYGNGFTPYVAISPSPQARVTDQYYNPVGAGVPVYWSANTSNGAVLNVGAGSQTSAAGTAQVTSWTLGEGLNQLFASIYSDAQTPPAGFLPAQFSASTPTGVVVFSCGVGSSKIDLGPMTIPAPNSSVKAITLQMSVTGQSNFTSAYQASVSVRLDSYNGTQVGTGSGIVQLPGNNATRTPVTLHFDGNGVPRQTGNHTLWFRLTFSNLPATRKIQVWYNSSFANNSPCKDAKVYAPTYPASTTFKAGLSITATN